MNQNESTEKELASQKASDDDDLIITDSNIIEPMEITKYGPQEQQNEQDWCITREETFTGITMQCVNNCSRNKDVCTQPQLDKTANNSIPREIEEVIQINTKELQADINQTTLIADQVCTTALEPYVESSSHALGIKNLDDHINLSQSMNTNKNVEKPRKNWKRMARLVGTPDGFNKDKNSMTYNENPAKTINEEHIQNIGDKRKSDTTIINNMEKKKSKIMVEREVSPKWLP